MSPPDEPKNHPATSHRRLALVGASEIFGLAVAVVEMALLLVNGGGAV
jgi:hypothetical protein